MRRLAGILALSTALVAPAAAVAADPPQLGDTDGDYDRLYSFGGRSMSIVGLG